MKILYVEDELSQNIERVLQLFSPMILSPKQREELRTIKNDDYGATNHDILDIIHSGVLTVETDFLAALQRVEREGDKYDLFIVDRELAKDDNAYKWEDVAAIAPEYTSNDFIDYHGREGDYLFKRLMRRDIKAKCLMFYFLTGHPDMIRCQGELRPYMEAGWFNNEQVLDKGNIDHLRRLCDVICQSAFLSVRYKYLSYFEKVEALDDRQETLNRLVKIFEAQEQCKKENRGGVLAEARNLVEALVSRLCVRNNFPDSGNTNDNLTELGPYNNHIQRGRKIISRCTMSMGKSVYTLCSKYGSHPKVVPDDIFNCALYATRAFIATYQDPDE